MSMIEVGKPAVLFTTRDKKFISGLSTSEVQNIYNYTIQGVAGEGVFPWICTLWDSNYLVVGIGRMFRLIKYGWTSKRNIWLDDNGNMWFLSGEKDLITIAKENWKEYENSLCYVASGVTDDTGGRMHLGNDMLFIVGNKKIRGWSWDRETGATEPEWDWTTLSGTPYDFQWREKYDELVCGNYEGNIVTLVDGSTGEIKATRDIGHASQQVAIDKYGRYWFQEYHGKKITVCEPEDLTLVDITINGETYNGTFSVPFISEARGIGENSEFDIIMTDYNGNYPAFFSAKDDYSNIMRVSLGSKTYKAAPLGDKNFWFLTYIDGYKCFVMNPINQALTEIALYSYRPYGQGDPGLGRYKTWGRSWKPDVSAIYDYLYTPLTEES